ncbi:MAG: sodium:proline symporter [Pseudomonadota bacterium]
MLIGLGLYLAAMLAIGAHAWRGSGRDIDTYLLGGRRLGPVVAGLSAGVSELAGWTMLVLPAAVFAGGLSAAWVVVGLIAGTLLNWIVVAPRLRARSALVGDALTLPDYLGKRWPNGDLVRGVASVLIVLRTLFCAAAGLAVAGAVSAALGTGYATGVIGTAIVVAAYTLLGGFRAVTLTQAVQACLIVAALVIVPWVAISGIKGWDVAQGAIRWANRAALDPFAGTTTLGIVSMLAWGLGAFGQPTILLRFMAIRSARDVPVAGAVAVAWTAAVLAGAVMLGLGGLAYVTARGVEGTDSEALLLLLAQLLFHPVIAGFLVAAVLAAIMAGLAAQFQVAAGSIAQDLVRRFRPGTGVPAARLAVTGFAIAATLLALDPATSALRLLTLGWAEFGAAFGPVVILSLFWERTTQGGALAGMLAGAGAVAVWNALGSGNSLYAIVPGFIAGWLAVMLASLVEAAVRRLRGVK